MAEITLPESKPALEWVNGRALQKVSPQRKHSVAQTRFAGELHAWTRRTRSGIAGIEWGFQVAPPGEDRRPLVPDVAYLSYDRLPYETQMVTDNPRVAPDVVVEVLSPDDRHADVEGKARVYLAAGTRVVFLVDTELRTVTIRELGGDQTIDKDAVLTHDALPGFQLNVADLFSVPKPY
jgi:Uma2 family endonuclease